MYEPTVPVDDATWEPSAAAIQAGPPDDLPWRMWEHRLGTSEPVNQIAASVATKFTPGLDIDVTDDVDFAAHQLLATLVYRCTMREPLLSMERLASHLVRYPGIPKRLGLPHDNQPSADTLRWWWYEKLDHDQRERIEVFARSVVAPEVADRGEGSPLPRASSSDTAATTAMRPTSPRSAG